MFTAAGIRFSDVEMDEEDVAAPARDSVVTGRIPSMGLGRDRLRGKRCHPAQT
jgi:hypothetical protein